MDRLDLLEGNPAVFTALASDLPANFFPFSFNLVSVFLTRRSVSVESA